MIKLSIEEKAKAYDKALERAQALYNDKNEIGYANAESVLEEVFPLLKESEDERIKKTLINFFSKGAEYDSSTNGIKDRNIIAWLEKQGKPADINPSEFDLRLNRLLKQFETLPKEELASSLSFYLNVVQNNGTYNEEKQAEQKLPIEKLPEEMKTIGESLGFTSQEICDKYNQMVSDLIMSDGNEIKPKFKVGDTIRLKNSTAEYTIESISGGCYHGRGWGLNIIDADKSGDYVLVEQKPANKIKPKFKVGDWVVSPNGVYWHIDAIQNGRYEVTTDTGQCGNWPLDTNIYRLWTIQDAKDGNVLTNGDFPCIFKRCDDNDSLYVYCGINAHNDFSILSEDPENVWDDYSKQYFPATKEQRDLLFQKMKEAGYEWDAEKKELKKIEDEEYNGEDYGIDSLWHAKNILEKTFGSVDGYQTDDGILEHKCAIAAVNKLYKQKPKRMISAEAKEALYDKPDWSEKDENVLEDIEEAIINYWHGDTQDILLDWLKSIKQRIGG